MMSVSDECASEDNLDISDLYKDVYMRESSMAKELLLQSKAEK